MIQGAIVTLPVGEVHNTNEYKHLQWNLSLCQVARYRFSTLNSDRRLFPLDYRSGKGRPASGSCHCPDNMGAISAPLNSTPNAYCVDQYCVPCTRYFLESSRLSEQKDY